MTSKLKYHKDYTELGATYRLVLPLSLEDVVPEDDPGRRLRRPLLPDGMPAFSSGRIIRRNGVYRRY